MTIEFTNLATLLNIPDSAEAIAELAGEFNVSLADLKRAENFVSSNEEDNALTSISFSVLGQAPVAKRPRASRIRNGTGETTGIRMHAADGGKQRTLKHDIIATLPADHIPFSGEVELQITVYKPCLASWSNYKQFLAEIGYIRPDRRPDYDNYAKIITDAMREIVFLDDSLVVVGNVSLFYSNRPRVEFVVSGRPKSLTK